MIWLVLFWFAAVSLFWTYAGYPLLLLILTFSRRTLKVQHRTDLPGVSFLVLTYNEAKVIRDKLNNSLALDYPRHLLEIIVVDSASDDGTLEIASEFVPRGVRVAQQGERRGKAAAINFGLLQATHDIVVITDANAMMAVDGIRQLVPHFNDPQVGGVTGGMSQRAMSATNISRSGGLYWRLEQFMRRREAQLHSVIAMSGEVSAYRKHLFMADGAVKPWYTRGATDDFEQTMYIIRQGLRVRYEPKAVVWEPAPDNETDLASQKIRIITQTIVSVIHNRRMLFNPRFGWYGWFILPSRKVLPLLSPLFLAIVVISSLALYQDPFFFALFILLCVVVVIYYASRHWPALTANKITGLLVFFLQLNEFVVRSWIKFFRGQDFTVWDKINSSRISSRSS